MINSKAREEIARGAAILRAGGLVAFPTETVYGLGADATNPSAVARIFEVKGRPRFDPLIVHVRHLLAAKALTSAFPDAALTLAERFWPGPLTLVLPKAAIIPDIVTAGEPTVALRVPRHPIALALLEAAGCPIAAPSANLFGRTSPTRKEHVTSELVSGVDLVLDGGPSEVGVESTIIAFVDGEPWLLRPGGIPVEAIEPLVGSLRDPTREPVRDRGPVRDPVPDLNRDTSRCLARDPCRADGTICASATGSTDGLPLSPGRLRSHYAPRTPLYLARPSSRAEAKVGRLVLTRPPRGDEDCAAIEVLSESGDLREAAANLFAALRRLDASGVDYILADEVPEEGLGRAIMDRLRRAASEPT